MRTVDNIFQELLLEKQTLSKLDTLSANDITDEQTLIPKLDDGTAPEWVLWLYNFAVASQTTEGLIDTYQSQIESYVNTKEVGTLGWYMTKLKEFQIDDLLIVDPVTYQVGYATVDITKQVIGSVAGYMGGRILYLKVKKKDSVDGLFTQLELDQIIAYVNQFKVLGTYVIIENYTPDLLTLNMEIYYSSNYNKLDVQTRVEGVINDYIKNIDFNSVLYIYKLIDELQKLNGVAEPRFLTGYKTVGTQVTVFEYQIDSKAGWFIINPDTALDVTINYIIR